MMKMPLYEAEIEDIVVPCNPMVPCKTWYWIAACIPIPQVICLA